jgi:hypothetical protein
MHFQTISLPCYFTTFCSIFAFEIIYVYHLCLMATLQSLSDESILKLILVEIFTARKLSTAL